MKILKALYVVDRKNEFLLNRLEQLKTNRCVIHIRHLCCPDEEFQKVLKKKHDSSDRTIHIESINSLKLDIETAVMEMIGCEYEEAARIYHTKLHSGVCMDLIEANIEYLKQHGADNDAIKSCFEITLLPLDVLRRRLGLLSGISSFNVVDLLPLVAVDDETLNIFIRFDHHAIVSMCKKLNVPMMSAFKCLAACPKLMKHQPSSLQAKLDILLAHDNFDKDTIIKQWDVFLLSPEFIKMRLNELSEWSLDKIKAYMILDLNTTFSIKRKHEEKKVLTEFNDSTLTYLSTRFGWTDEQVQRAVDDKPFLTKMTFDKVSLLLLSM